MDPNVSGTSSGIPTSGPTFSALHRLRRKRKPPRMKDPLDDILLKFLTAQRVVEERFLQMEERRMQRDMELEDRRMQLEQRRMELEREHEYRMFTIFAQMVNALRNGGSTQTLGLDLSQAFSQSSGQATGPGGHPSSTSASKDGNSRVTSYQSKSLPNGLKDVLSNAEHNPTFQQPKSSIYLSKRGNEINSFGIIEEGYTAYHADKHDEDKNPNGFINLGTSENKLCFDLLSERLMRADIYQIDPPLLQYPDWKGHEFLRVQVGKFLTYYCKAPVLLKPENIVVVNGCGSLFSSLSAVLCDPGDKILLPSPYYGVIKDDIFFYSAVKPLLVHLESKVTDEETRPFQLTVGKLEKSMQIAKLQGTRVTAMILTNPHNPLGDIYSAKEMKEFLEFANRYKLHVIVDEVYMLSIFGDVDSFQSVLSFDKLPDPQRTHVMWGISKVKNFIGTNVKISVYVHSGFQTYFSRKQISRFKFEYQALTVKESARDCPSNVILSIKGKKISEVVELLAELAGLLAEQVINLTSNPRYKSLLKPYPDAYYLLREDALHVGEASYVGKAQATVLTLSQGNEMKWCDLTQITLVTALIRFWVRIQRYHTGPQWFLGSS
ncbi:probable inactive 1-aminocyclopropane-1-carboxylate synthase-like protein 2 [Rhincodon typus]|uniref:probable inactive 1-aminocyclopropane-1-carboxylate synthase-like protein 2 n=1 Tax=Rhincodon typus TaxID=259920 RepID=UPI00202E27EA|nr:probable inactive 1-aminocyclopropane-1-carboxylate synthase-like protein 2 [Rhincodon typus]